MTNPEIAQALTAYQKCYDFTSDRFTRHVEVWQNLLDFSDQKPARILEVGSHEGMSAIWLIENKLKAGDEIHVVDSWEFRVERDGTSKFEERFDQNMNIALEGKADIKLYKRKGKSRSILPQMLALAMNNTFDLVYIDGCHEAASVLEDLVFANALCKVGGVIICDDYLWNYGADILKTPKFAVDSFSNCFRGKIDIIKDIPLFQICMRKLSD